MHTRPAFSFATLLAFSSLLLQPASVLAQSSTTIAQSSTGTLTTHTVSGSGTKTTSRKATGTATGEDYCITNPPSTTLRTRSTDVIPPIPCTAGYYVQQGVCCKGDSLEHCTGTDLVWSLPLASCVTVNPQYNGCPGNMLGGVCCDGPGVGFVGNGTGKATQVQCDGKTVFVVTTSGSSTITVSNSDLFSTTSMLPLVTDGLSTTTGSTPGGGVASTTSRPAAAGPTAVLEVAKLVIVGIAGAAALL